MPSSQAAEELETASNIFDVEYELIVDFRFSKYILASDIFIYTLPDSTLIPLQPLFDALEFPILVVADPDELRATGWFIKEENVFELDLSNRSLYIGGRQVPFPAGAIIESDNFDLYADIELLSQWFPLNFLLNTGRLQLEISASEALPFEARRAREQLRSQVMARQPYAELPLLADNYQMLGLPTVDFSLANISNGDSLQTGYSVLATGDLLRMETRFVSSRSTADEINSSLVIRRKPNQPGERLLGVLDEVILGDISGSSDELIFKGGQGLGIDLQQSGSQTRRVFDEKVIEGDGPVGWEAELYRNGVLIDFQTVGADGRYRFEDVPVDYGENIFDVRLFGPQGQERNRRESVSVGDSMIPKGESYAHFNYVALGKEVLQRAGERLTEHKMAASWEYGLTDSLSIGFTSAIHEARFISDDSMSSNAPSALSKRSYQKIRLQKAFSTFSTGLDWVTQDGKGNAASLSAQTLLGGVSISLTSNHFRNFISERNTSLLLVNDTELRIAGVFSNGFTDPISYAITADQQNFIDDAFRQSISSKLGFRSYGGFVTLNTRYTLSDSAESLITGGASYFKRFGRNFRVRGGLSYNITDPSLDSAALSLTWSPNRKLMLQTQMDIDFSEGSENSYGVSGTWLFNSVALTFASSITEGGESSVMLRAEFSLGSNHNSSWSIRGGKHAQNGSALVKVFLDKDQDGEFSEGDEPLQGVKFKGRSEWQDQDTDLDGTVQLRGLSASSPTRLTLDENSLEDPFWRPQLIEVQLVSHAGGRQYINIPVVLTVEVEGTVSIEVNGVTRGIGGMPLYLVDSLGERVATVITEYDGYYYFSGISGGDYSLELDSETMDRLRVNPIEPIAFFADTIEGIVYMDEIVLSRIDGPQVVSNGEE